jgi:hypothetical protein
MERFEGKIWSVANKKAEEKAGNHISTYNRVKQSLSPSRLIIHVTSREEVGEIMKNNTGLR